MPWKADRIPTYRLNRRSGRVVTLRVGRDVYLGAYGSPESKAEYRRVIAEFLAAGREDPQPPPADALTWCELAARYLRYAAGYYRAPDGSESRTVKTIKCALASLLPLYGDQSVESFGPLALKAVRNRIIETGKARKTVNDYVATIKRIVRWGVGEELGVAEGHGSLARGRGVEAGPVGRQGDSARAARAGCHGGRNAPALLAGAGSDDSAAAVDGHASSGGVRDDSRPDRHDREEGVWLYKPVHLKLADLGPGPGGSYPWGRVPRRC